LESSILRSGAGRASAVALRHFKCASLRSGAKRAPAVALFHLKCKVWSGAGRAPAVALRQLKGSSLRSDAMRAPAVALHNLSHLRYLCRVASSSAYVVFFFMKVKYSLVIVCS